MTTRNWFNRGSVAGIVLVALSAAGAYVALQTPSPVSERPPAQEIASHALQCSACRLPLVASSADEPSHYGPAATPTVALVD